MKTHLLKNTRTYLILLALCAGVLLLVILGITVLDKMGKGHLVNDDITGFIVFFICIPGILIGLTGAINCAIRKKLNHNV
jgi:hypothetical protein